MAETPTDPPTAALPAAMKAAQSEALTAINASLQDLRTRFDGTDEDSYATRLELRNHISDLADAANAIGRPSGSRINLGRTVTDDGYDPEAAAADRDSGIEHVSAADQARQRHDTMIGLLTPTIDSLRAAGFTVDTKLTFVEPPEYREYQDMAASDARTSATQEALKQIEQSAPRLQGSDPKFANALQNLVRQGSDLDQQWQPAFQHKVAYALQDLEKTPVGPVTLSGESRAEMTRLAASAPGLENERMLALMNATASIAGNRGLIREIRITGADIGLQTDQNTQEVESRIAALENKVRLAPQPSQPTQSAGNNASDASAGETRAGREQPTASERNAVQDVLSKMEQVYPLVSGADPKLAERLDYVLRQGKGPDRRIQPDVQHYVAYTLQDLEKRVVPLALSQDTRNEMARLASSAPGLENDRMLALMGRTASIGNQTVVNEIRKLAGAIGRQADQEKPDIHEKIDALETKVRLAAGPSPTADEGTQSPPGERQPAGNGVNGTRQPASGGGNAGAQNGGQQPQIYYPRSVLDTLLSGLRFSGQGNDAQPPGQPAETPMADRLAAFEKRTQDERDEGTLRGAIKSGRAALDALQAFNYGEGAAVMSRIHEAAKSDPGGLPAVLSEMRDGGRFADLRGQFNTALEKDRGLANAYDKAAAALGSYGTHRSTAQEILSRRSDLGAINARFEQMDAEIGEAAAATPSRNDGRSMFDDLAKKAAELLQRAVDAVKAAFTGSPTATSQPTASPSMSP